MLDAKTKDAILNGAFAVTRDGRKVKYIGKTVSKNYPLAFVTVPEVIELDYNLSKVKIIFITDTWKGTIDNEDYPFDIIGLWNEPTPKVTLELPKSFKPEIREDYFTVINVLSYQPLKVSKTYNANSTADHELINAGLCFRTEADAQAWIDAFKQALGK